MDCYRRARNARSLAERCEHLNLAVKLARTSATLVGALDKHRGKGQQKMRVEHVHVHDGAQAVVGNIERPEGVEKSEEQPHAKPNTGTVADAPEPEMRRHDAESDAVPVARSGDADLRRSASNRTAWKRTRSVIVYLVEM